MVYLFQNNMVFYHGFPVSKHHGFYGISWYFTMVYLFQNTMAFTMVYFHKTPWHLPWYIFTIPWAVDTWYC